VEHLRACHSKSPTVIILQDWPNFKAVTKELKLIKLVPKGEKVLFMRTTPTCTYKSPDIITSHGAINYWSIDAKAHAFFKIDEH